MDYFHHLTAGFPSQGGQRREIRLTFTAHTARWVQGHYKPGQGGRHACLTTLFRPPGAVPGARALIAQ